MINLLIATGILLVIYIIIGIIVIRLTNHYFNKYPEAKKPKKEEIDRLLELDDFEEKIGNPMRAVR